MFMYISITIISSGCGSTRPQMSPSPVQPPPKYGPTHPQFNMFPIHPVPWRLSVRPIIIHVLIRWLCVDNNQHILNGSDQYLNPIYSVSLANGSAM